jgi:AAA family ATP:ADP antiporter
VTPLQQHPASTDAPASLFQKALRLFVNVRAAEVAALGWAWLYFFCVLSSYYVIRPIRDELGVASGVNNLPFLYLGTLSGMALLNPPFAAMVSRWPRSIFVPRTYRFFVSNLVLFFALLALTRGTTNLWVGRVFFVWISVFNMFVVSVFWATMVDLFTEEQGKRLFGFIAAGATIGAITGSTITATLVTALGPARLLLVSAVLLELAVFAFRRTAAVSAVQGGAARAIREGGVIGGGVWDGLTRAVSSPYLRQICVYMLLFTLLSTFLYYQQATIVEPIYTDRAERTQFFARVDLAVNTLTLFVQLFFTSRIIQGLGVARTLTIMPLVTIVGFLTLAIAPAIAAVVIFQVIRRATEFALARPTRELLYSVVPREDMYKAKSFIDTFVYRTGDQVGIWSSALLTTIGLGVSGVAWVAVPFAVAWLFNGWWLGRRQDEMTVEAKERAAS